MMFPVINSHVSESKESTPKRYRKTNPFPFPKKIKTKIATRSHLDTRIYVHFKTKS
jgi:hypothetical protein